MTSFKTHTGERLSGGVGQGDVTGGIDGNDATGHRRKYVGDVLIDTNNFPIQMGVLYRDGRLANECGQEIDVLAEIWITRSLGSDDKHSCQCELVKERECDVSSESPQIPRGGLNKCAAGLA